MLSLYGIERFGRIMGVAALLLGMAVISPRAWAIDEDDDDEAPKEVLLAFKYGDFVDAYVSARYYQSTIYLPLGELFELLHIHYETAPESNSVRGSFPGSENRYEIDVHSGEAVVDDRAVSLESQDVLTGNRAIYFHSEAFQKLFGLHFQVDMRRLSMRLETDEPLPIARSTARERRQRQVHDPIAALRHAPLLYPRDNKWLGGGVVDYAISSSWHQNNRSHAYDVRVGAEVLGGGLRWNLRGTSMNHLTQSKFRWDYAVRNNPFLSQIRVGHQTSAGLHRAYYRGITITNDPVTPRTFFSDYQITGMTHPDWDVELYLDDRLVDFGTADASGAYDFTIPLLYGTSDVRMEYYGPGGSVIKEERRLQIPYTFLPAGETSYSLNVGEHLSDGHLLTHGRLAHGLTSRTTTHIGVDHFTTPSQTNPIVYAGISTRLGDHYLMSLRTAPTALWRLSLRGAFPSNASVEAQYTGFAANPLYNRDERREELLAQAYLPLQTGPLQLSLRTRASWRGYANRDVYDLQGRVQTRLGGANVLLTYRHLLTAEEKSLIPYLTTLEPLLRYTIHSRHGWFRRLRGTRVAAGAAYDMSSKKVSALRFELSRQVSRSGRLQFNVKRHTRSSSWTGGFRFIYDLPFARSTNQAHFTDERATYTHNVRGSAGVDWSQQRIVFDNQPAVGRANATVRTFLDTNDNGRYDRGEQIAENPGISIQTGRTVETTLDEFVHIRDLLPHAQYTAEVTEAAPSNPLWIPKHTSFSFITAPNTFKQIDVPLYAAGVIEGHARLTHAGQQKPIPGLRVLLHRRDGSLERDLRTFSDGTFYDATVPPGEYAACVEPSLLDELGLESEPRVQYFTVENTSEGDYVDGLRFLLHERETEDGVREGSGDQSASSQEALQRTAACPGMTFE